MPILEDFDEYDDLPSDDIIGGCVWCGMTWDRKQQASVECVGGCGKLIELNCCTDCAAEQKPRPHQCYKCWKKANPDKSIFDEDFDEYDDLPDEDEVKSGAVNVGAYTLPGSHMVEIWDFPHGDEIHTHVYINSYDDLRAIPYQQQQNIKKAFIQAFKDAESRDLILRIRGERLHEWIYDAANLYNLHVASRDLREDFEEYEDLPDEDEVSRDFPGKTFQIEATKPGVMPNDMITGLADKITELGFQAGHFDVVASGVRQGYKEYPELQYPWIEGRLDTDWDLPFDDPDDGTTKIYGPGWVATPL